MIWNLFIDDERMPTDVTWGNETFYSVYPWTIARSLNEVQELIGKQGFPDFVSLDHDLGDGEPTGHDIAKWLIKYDLDTGTMPPDFQYYTHSRNPVGKANIDGLLSNYLNFR